MELYNITGIPNKMSLRQWMSTGTWLAWTLTVKYWDNAIVWQLLATSAKKYNMTNKMHYLLSVYWN
jgi:hypothetical protein